MNDLIAENKIVVLPKVPTLDECIFCRTQTYRKCSDIPICIICEDEKKNQYDIEQKKEVITQ